MPEASDRRPVGVIGLGKMGSALARALLGHGYPVTVWNRTPSKCAPLKEAGAHVAPSAEEAMNAARIVVLCLTGPSASDGILRAAGVAASLRSKILVQLSTLPAEQSRDLDRWAHENGVEYLYGSIFGYPSDVVRGTCTTVYSGSKRAFDAHQGVLAAMGGNPKFAGESTDAVLALKQAMLSYSFGSWLAFFHGAALCHKAGFPIETYAETVVDTFPMRTTAVWNFGARIAARNYADSEAQLELYAEAYAPVVELSKTLEIDATVPEMVAGFFARAIADGHAGDGLPSLFELMIRKPAD